MKQFNRKEKMDKMEAFLLSDEWDIIKTEIEKLEKGRRQTINQNGEFGEEHKIFFNAGIRFAYEEVLKLPGKIKHANESILKRMLSEKGEE